MSSWFNAPDPGYGTGFANSWQGWLLLIGFAAIVALVTHLWSNDAIVVLAIVLPLTGLFVIIARAKTEGGWKWRNSKKEK